MENQKYLIWFNMVFNNNYQTIWKIIRSYYTLHDAYCAVVSGTCKTELTDRQRENLKEDSLERAEKVVSYCSGNDINIVCYDSDDYPEQLRNIQYPPIVLYCKGDISCVSHGKNITCVGTRNPSEYTVATITRICTELVKVGFTIISGFAQGSDITSHLSAVNLNRPTACILGCGIAVDYPKPNYHYREDIIKNGGVFISEYAPFDSALPYRFPKRNVILASLSYATIVFEASEKSGSLSTAREAVRQGRKLLCIPPADIFNKRYFGNIEILRNGAEPLYTAEDVFRIYGIKNYICTDSASDSTNSAKVKTRKTNNTKKDTKKKKSEKSAVEPLRHEVPERPLTPVQLKILDLLENDTLYLDVIVSKLDMDISQAMVEIFDLQMMGVIEEVSGSRFRKC